MQNGLRLFTYSRLFLKITEENPPLDVTNEFNINYETKWIVGINYSLEIGKVFYSAIIEISKKDKFFSKTLEKALTRGCSIKKVLLGTFLMK